MGYSGTGTFTQSGGTNTDSGNLYLGYNSAANATYALSGGQASAAAEFVGYSSAAKAAFQQTGGTNTVGNFSLSGGQYQLTGGTLQVNGSFVNQGVFEGGSTPATLVANGVVDLTSGTWENLADLSVDMGANSLLIVPAGFNPSTGFASYTSLGLTHTQGTTLTVPAGQSFAGSFSTSDPVVCQGTIAATSGSSINFNNGLVVSGSGTVTLGGGSLTVNDTISGLSGGTLSAANQYVGSGGTGLFTHSAGTNTISAAPFTSVTTRPTSAPTT